MKKILDQQTSKFTMDHHVFLCSHFLLKIIKTIWVCTPYSPYNTCLSPFRDDICVIPKCLMSLLGLCNNQTVPYTVLSLTFLLFSLWYHTPPSHVLERSTACLPLPLSKLLRHKMSEIVHPSLVQVPL